jgi:hypothetical protein
MSKRWSIEYRLPAADDIEDDPSFIGDVLAYMNSPEGELFLRSWGNHIGYARTS